MKHDRDQHSPNTIVKTNNHRHKAKTVELTGDVVSGFWFDLRTEVLRKEHYSIFIAQRQAIVLWHILCPHWRRKNIESFKQIYKIAENGVRVVMEDGIAWTFYMMHLIRIKSVLFLVIRHLDFWMKWCRGVRKQEKSVEHVSRGFVFCMTWVWVERESFLDK